MTSNELTLHPDQTFRRIWTLLMGFYVVAVVFLQLKGEALRPAEVLPPPEASPRMARILTAPPSPPAPSPMVAPENPAPAQAPVQEAMEEVKPEVKEALKKKLPETPAETPKRPVEKPKADAPPISREPAAAPPKTDTIAKAAPQEQIKKVGLLGLLGGGGTDPSAKKPFASLKEIPSSSGVVNEKTPAPPHQSFQQETVEQIRKKTLAAQEKSLVQTRKAAVEENLSEIRATNGSLELNHSAISEIAGTNKEKLLALYRKRLQQNPNVRGSLTVEFVISPEGTVLKCQILNSSLSDPVFESEIIREILQWRFPSAEKGATTVLYPLSFSPAG